MSSNVVTRSSIASAARMAITPTVPIPAAPYRGLEPFRYVDSAIFFARDRELRKLMRYITMYRSVLLYGDSGSGKSSLINAGLIPAILKEGFVADRIRVQPREDEEFIIERMPQATPSNGSASFLPSNFTEEDYKSTSRIVVPAKNLKRIVEDFSSDKTPLLIFDQFEELVTLFEESPPNKDIMKALAIQEAILKCLVDLNGSHQLKVKLLFVFREDYLAKLTKFFVKCPDLVDHYQRLTPPPKNALQSIIRGPFEKFPGQFGTELSTELTSDLSQQIISGTESPGLNLSEVQIVCLKLWGSDDPKTLLTKRNIQGILEDFLDESLSTLSPDLRQPALALLRKMVTSSGTRNVISEDDLLQLVRKEEKFSTEHLKKALEALVSQTKLVRRERRLDVITYQLVSEFLIPWIKQQQQVQHARMLRRRAIRWISVSLFIALVMAAASLYVWRFRTERALREEAVTRLTAQRDTSEAARVDAENKYLQLVNAVNTNNPDEMIKALSEKVTSLTRDLQKSKNDYSQLKSQSDSLQEERDALKIENGNLEGQKQLLVSANQTLNARLDARSTGSGELEIMKKEVIALTDQVTTLTNEKNVLIQEIENLKKLILPSPTGTVSNPVFTHDELEEGDSVVLAGAEFHGLLKLRLGDVLKKNKPIYIYKTDGDEDDENARITRQYFQPSKTNFSMYFQYEGKRYRLEGRIAGGINSTLRDIKIWRL